MLAIGGRPPAHATDAVISATRPNLLVVVAAPTVAQAFDPAAARWLQREPGSATRAHGETLLAALDAAPPVLTLGSTGAVIAGAVAGLGATLVPREAVKDRLASGELVELLVPGTPLRRPWRAVTHEVVPAAAAMLITHLIKRGGWRAPSGRESPSLPSASSNEAQVGGISKTIT
jgi:LysR family transcriptional regulator, low CO2-responsive transcriptional regulator